MFTWGHTDHVERVPPCTKPTNIQLPTPTQKVIIGSTSALSCLRHQAGLGWRHSLHKPLSLFFTLFHPQPECLAILCFLLSDIFTSTWTPLLTSELTWLVQSPRNWSPYWNCCEVAHQSLASFCSSRFHLVPWCIWCLVDVRFFGKVGAIDWLTPTCSASPSSVGQLKGNRAQCPPYPTSTAWASCVAPAAAKNWTTSGWNARAPSSVCPS